MSLARFPGKTGEFFYNNFFLHYGLDASYVARKCINLERELGLLRSGEYCGASITMPFKQDVIGYLDYTAPEVTKYGVCNTVKQIHGKLFGYNADLSGVEWVINQIPPDLTVQVLGDGAMGRMFAKVLHDRKYAASVYSRKKLNWDERHVPVSVIINATALGTLDQASPLDQLSEHVLIVDLALKKGSLADQARANKIEYLSGLEFYKQVFQKQFEIYTGILPNLEYFDVLKKGMQST